MKIAWSSPNLMWNSVAERQQRLIEKREDSRTEEWQLLKLSFVGCCYFNSEKSFQRLNGWGFCKWWNSLWCLSSPVIPLPLTSHPSTKLPPSLLLSPVPPPFLSSPVISSHFLSTSSSFCSHHVEGVSKCAQFGRLRGERALRQRSRDAGEQRRRIVVVDGRIESE